MKNILSAQKEYYKLLLDFKENKEYGKLELSIICEFLDEINCFWLKRSKILEFELEELTEKKMCFALFGVNFINPKGYEQYYFKSFGDIQILEDPILKLDKIFRQPSKEINLNSSMDYFNKVFKGTLGMATSINRGFLFLPIDIIAYEYIEGEQEFVDSFFWKFISSIFDKNFSNKVEFTEKFDSYEDIYEGLASSIRDNIIFNDFDDIKLSLRQRIEKFQNEQLKITSIHLNKTDAEKFLTFIYIYISQISDILHKCSILRIYPFIKYNVTFNYLTLVMHFFIDDTNLRSIIEKSIICFLFSNNISQHNLGGISFTDYCQKLDEKSLFNSIIEKIHNSGLNVFNDNPSKVISIIRHEFDGWIQ